MNFKVPRYIAPDLLGLTLLMHSSPILIFQRVQPPTNLPPLLAAGEVFLLSGGEFRDWRVDGRPFTELPNGKIMGATGLKGDQVELSAWRRQDDAFEYFRKRVPLVYKDHQTKHRALRIPASTWSRLQSDKSLELSTQQKLLFRKILNESPGDGESLCWTQPLNSPVTSKFGRARVLPNGNMYHHTGTDFAAVTGTPIYPAAEGVVALSDDFVVSGGFVALYHGFHLTTTYAHLSQRDVQAGDKIASTQALGLSGATGRVTGPHLHWEFFWRDRPVDPSLALETLQGLCDPK